MKLPTWCFTVLTLLCAVKTVVWGFLPVTILLCNELSIRIDVGLLYPLEGDCIVWVVSYWLCKTDIGSCKYFWVLDFSIVRRSLAFLVSGLLSLTLPVYGLSILPSPIVFWLEQKLKKFSWLGLMLDEMSGSFWSFWSWELSWLSLSGNSMMLLSSSWTVGMLREDWDIGLVENCWRSFYMREISLILCSVIIISAPRSRESLVTLRQWFSIERLWEEDPFLRSDLTDFASEFL